jgi:hypothetical protein
MISLWSSGLISLGPLPLVGDVAYQRVGCGSIGSQYPHERLAVDFAGGKHGQLVLGD